MTRMAATRDGYGQALLEIADNPKVVVLEADLGKSTKSLHFRKEYPERTVSCGIGEQNMLLVGAGLASSGYIPFASTFAIFTERAFEQMRNGVARPNLAVHLCGSHGGTHTGTDGSTSNGDLIQLTSTRHNQGDCYSTSNYYFTAPVAGVYTFTGQVWAKNGTSHARWQFSYHNGSSWSSITQHGFHGNGVNKNDFMQNASITYYMNSGDRMGMRVDNGPLAYYRGGGGGAHTYFCGHLVG